MKLSVNKTDTVEVSFLGEEYDPYERAYRSRYRFIIHTGNWEYITDELRSGVGVPVNLTRAMNEYLGFLTDTESDMWPEYVREWVEDESLYLENLYAITDKY